MIRGLLPVAVFVALLYGTAANAADQDANTTTAFKRCEALARSELDIANCLDAELARQKTILNVAYTARISGEDPKRVAEISKAQKAWVAFRDADCAAQMVHGGSAGPQSWLACMVRLTAARAVEMETYGSW